MRANISRQKHFFDERERSDDCPNAIPLRFRGRKERGEGPAKTWVPPKKNSEEKKQGKNQKVE